MPISVVCANCGRSYAADESLAGRRVRCRGCGEVVQIPADALDAPDLEAIEQAQQTFVGEASPGADSAPGAGQPGLPAGMEDLEISGAGIEAAGRANLRYNFFGAKTLDDVLPFVLVAGSLLWLGVQTSRNNPTELTWITATRVGLPLLLFGVIVCPLAYGGLRAAGRKVGFQLPRRAWWRTFACYLPAMTLTAALWMMGHGSVVSFVMGLLGGLLLASACVWVLFRLKPEEAPVTSGYGAAGFAAGAVLSAALLAGLNVVARSVVESTQAFDAVPVSPLGSGFDWVDRERAEAMARMSRPTPGPRPTDRPRAPVPAVDAPGNGAVVDGGAPATVVDRPPATGDVLLDGGALPSGVEAPQSPLIAAFVAGPSGEPAGEYLAPMTPSPYLAGTRREGDVITVTLWQVDPWQKRGQARFSAASGIDERIVISPGGDWAARLASFPTRSIHVWSMSQDRDTNRIPLDVPPELQPELVGFLSADVVVLRWNDLSAGTTVLEFYDVGQGARAREAMRLGFVLQFPNALAFSPDGKHIAAAGKVEGEPRLWFFPFESDRTPRSVRIAALDPRWPVDPTGMVFSPEPDRDGDYVLAMMFEQAGAALVLLYREDGTPMGERVFDPGPPSPRPAFYSGSSLQWLLGPGGQRRFLMMYGRTVIDPTTGQVVGALDVSDVERCLYVDRATLVYVAGGARGQRYAARARMDLSTLR